MHKVTDATLIERAQEEAAGGDWDEGDTGWWAYVDSDTQKRIEPHGWTPASADDDEE